MIEEELDESAYKVTLPSFHGPLDLLLHLIKQNEVDIYDIPIALVTEQYNAYLEAMEELNLEIAADYIYMAALLIHIKSKMLLPRDENAEQIEDPRAELVNRLLEYQRFKAVAESFAEVDVLRMGVWPRPATPIPGTDASEIDMSEVGLFDLIDAFRGALNRYKQNHPQAIELHRTVHKISDKMRELYTVLDASDRPQRPKYILAIDTSAGSTTCRASCLAAGSCRARRSTASSRRSRDSGSDSPRSGLTSWFGAVKPPRIGSAGPNWSGSGSRRGWCSGISSPLVVSC